MTLRNQFIAFEHQITARSPRARASLHQANVYRSERSRQRRSITEPTSSVSALDALVIYKLTDALYSSPQSSYESERNHEHARQSHQGLSFTYLPVSIDARPQQ